MDNLGTTLCRGLIYDKICILSVDQLSVEGDIGNFYLGR